MGSASIVISTCFKLTRAILTCLVLTVWGQQRAIGAHQISGRVTGGITAASCAAAYAAVRATVAHTAARAASRTATRSSIA